MTREDLIREFVLDEICDDYENVDQIIFPDVSRVLAVAGIKLERREIVEAVRSLVADGLATAHRLTESPAPLPEVPSLEVVEDDETGYEVYFWITDLGHKHHERSETVSAFFDGPFPSETRTKLLGLLSNDEIAALRNYLRERYR